MITIIPAVDLQKGRCVRLRQGQAEESTVYSDDPVAMALRWEGEGATYLHVVDLDGAFEGHPVHTDVIHNMADAVSIPIEVGGGVRSEDDIRRLLDHGVDRVIVGTWACQSSGLEKGLFQKYGRRLAIGIDARNGMVQVRGWTATTSKSAGELAIEADGLGVDTIIFTDTARDGMMEGINTEALREICTRVKCHVVASGGISTSRDIRALCELRQPNLSGAIVGKALYEGKVTLAELMRSAALRDE